MGQKKRHWFSELFPGWLDRGLGIAGFGVFTFVPWLADLPNKVLIAAGGFALFAIFWVAIRGFLIVIEIFNSTRQPDIKVKANLSSLILNVPEEDGAKLATKKGLSLCLTNQGKPTSCILTLRSPSFLELSIECAEGQSSMIRTAADCHVRKFNLAHGDIQFLTITKFELQFDMATRYRETTKLLHIEVAYEDGTIIDALDVLVGL